MKRIACSAVVSVLSGVALGAAEVRPAAKAPQVRVMTYNVRYSAGDKKSPDNNWKARRDDFARTVERENPDVVGFQEVLPDQRKWLERRFPEYAFTGEGRNADRVNGEASPVAFRRDRFEAVTNGTFWLSETPDVPGSKSWNAAFPRICTYAVLKDKTTGKTFSFANTHTDHKSEEAREKGMLLIIERMKDFGRGAPVVLVGDHNCLEYEKPAKSVSKLLTDAIYLSKTPPQGSWRTFNFWHWYEKELSIVEALKKPIDQRSIPGDKSDMKRIDYIYVSPGTTVLDYRTVSDTRPGTKLYPSDHFPSVATLVLASMEYAFPGTNLIVNGTFESGEFSPWTRNDTKGKANKQGRVSVCAAGGNSWVDGALGGKALVVQSFNNRDKVWLDSTDSYALQSFKVDEPGKYRLSFDYAGRGHRDDKYWVRASCRVRVLHGADATGKALCDGAFSPVTKATYTRYSEVVDIARPGVYSLQFFLPQPVGTEPEACDKCVVIDNVCFARDGGRGATDLAFEPRGDEDRTAEVLAAVESGATLRFAKGEYHFRSPTKLYYYISNHDNPQPHSVFLPILNVTDMTMRGDGAVFVFHGNGIGMTLMDTRRVTLKGIAFEWARPPFSEAKVVSFDGKGAVLKQDPVRFPLVVEKGRLIAVGEGWRNHVPLIEAFAGETLDPVMGVNGMGMVSDLGDGTIRVEMGRRKWRMARPLRPGDIALIRSPYRPSPGISLCRAHDTLMEDCTWHGGDGMGLVAQRCENVTIRGSGKASDRTAGAFARKGAGYATALQADATHFSNCKGLVLVENCFFEATVDDAINIHSTSLMIESMPKPDTLVCRYMHKQSTGFEVFLPGERLRFIKAATLENGVETVVKEARITDPRHVTIRLADPVPSCYGHGDAVENADWQPAVVFRNNIARMICARAVLLTTPGKTVIEGNLFDSGSSQVIQLEGDASGWYESGACRDVTIRNNVFRNCAFLHGEGIIQIRPNLKDIKSQKERYHRNIVIERNRFETPRIPLLRACSVSNLVWRSNDVIYNDAFPARGKEPFVIDYSEGVDISN